MCHTGFSALLGWEISKNGILPKYKYVTEGFMVTTRIHRQKKVCTCMRDMVELEPNLFFIYCPCSTLTYPSVKYNYLGLEICCHILQIRHRKGTQIETSFFTSQSHLNQSSTSENHMLLCILDWLKYLCNILLS